MPSATHAESETHTLKPGATMNGYHPGFKPWRKWFVLTNVGAFPGCRRNFYLNRSSPWLSAAL
ncbi:hypothetical protein Sinac_2554 [Singulisphaera acidiphila DSM 18658]|uniref:Uncharacterized protein n=1 Tax=Singulisphaera acidiphila (strain ATCC BAA-1392 / DSM 18658 / VKM B-2454 / MOB10) TaxID=886293 RepID=L0DDE3_SINAD|nr:hypothetical protein Sinac_2554 [Singulisphaera acidiphila DSM 18658]